MRLFHLSHTDLDGHSCHVVASKFIENTKLYNANYGAEVSVKLRQICQDIFTSCKKNDQVLLLITDLNLTSQECDFIEQECEKLSNFGIDIELKLLDHHISGKEQAGAHKWYGLDIEKSATKLTFEYFCARFPSVAIEKEFELFVRSVNAVDIWLDNDDFFEFGKVFMRLVLEAKEINRTMFSSDHAKYRAELLKKALCFLAAENLENKHIELDDSVHKLRKEYLSGGKENNTIDNLTSSFIIGLLSQRKNQMSISIRDKKGIFTTGLGNVSVVANSFLKANDDFDFVLDISGKGNVSLRSNGKANVCDIARDYFGGGGHINASGGKLPNAREFYTYEEYLSNINNYISSKEF